MNIVDNILFEALNKLPNKNFTFEDLNGNEIDAVIGAQSNGSVVVGYQFNGSARHDENNNNPDARNLFYILGRVMKFVTNYAAEYKPQIIIIQSDNETGNTAQKRINIYKSLVDKNAQQLGYESSVARNAHGYYISLKRKSAV